MSYSKGKKHKILFRLDLFSCKTNGENYLAAVFGQPMLQDLAFTEALLSLDLMRETVELPF